MVLSIHLLPYFVCASSQGSVVDAEAGLFMCLFPFNYYMSRFKCTNKIFHILLINKDFKALISGNSEMGSLANSEDPDKMPQYDALFS